MTSSPEPRINNRIAERIRLYSKVHPIAANLYIFVLSLVISGTLKAVSLTGVRDLTDVGLNTFLGLAVGELFLVLLQLMATEGAIDDADRQTGRRVGEIQTEIRALDKSLDEKASQINQIALVNRGYHSALHFFAQLYMESGEPAHDAVRKPVSRLFANFHVEKKLIRFRGESLSRETYEEFWRYLVAQQKRRSEGDKPIIVITTHSAAVRLWTTPEFDDLWKLQDEFIRENGIIYRVLLRSTNSSEKTDDYREVLFRMRDQFGIQAYFLEISPDQRKVTPHDYLLVSFDDKTFGFSWLTDIDMHGNHSTVYGSTITVGRTSSREIAKRWDTLLGYLEDKHKKLIRINNGQQERDVLEKTPTKAQFDEMRSTLRRFDNMWSD